jgi:hydrogenase maturation protease
MLVIGCGNRLRGDDGVGPAVVDGLLRRGPPPGLRCLDAGTAGVDVVLAMRGEDRVVLVDACLGGGEPGTVRELRAEDLEPREPGPLSTHGIRWDRALALGRAVLQDAFPRSLVVYVVEAASLEPGDPLTPAVERAVERLVDELVLAAAR